MSSAPQYLQERLQQVFHDAVKNKEDFILYRDLARLIRSKVLRSSVSRASPFRKAIRVAVAEEIFFGRLVLNLQYAPPRLYVTPAGALFFATFRPFVPYGPGHVFPQRTNGIFRQGAIDEYVALAAIIKSILEILGTSNVADINMFTVTRLPETIRSYLESQRELCTNNASLVTRLNVLQHEVDELHVQLNEMTATEGDNSADDDHRPAVEREASVISLTDSVISLTDSDVSLTHSTGDTPVDKGSPMELEDGVSDYEGRTDNEEVGGNHSAKKGYLVEYETDYDDGSMDDQESVMEYEGSADGRKIGRRASARKGYAVEYDTDRDSSVDDQESVVEYEGSTGGRNAGRRASVKIGYAVEYDTDYDGSVDDQESVFEYGSTVDGRNTPIDYERSSEEFNRLYGGMDL
ncbi:hypothetical protein TRAPUB_13842 [Trametes pubescens]|uniref:Uncharacterized protein n=1 Tax=Trametes pubescens TaxID=154538 RepID=A0A1M2VQ31_TRAPU|nr:hypothetical protein TRAPUB_13842 [Trametes pubescens]